MRQKEFNVKTKSSDLNARRRVILLICILIMLITIALDIYFISGIFKGLM